MKTTRKQAKAVKIDWRRFDAMTEAQRHQAALNNPNARPMNDEDLLRMKRRVPKMPRPREDDPSAEEMDAIAAGSKEFREGRFVDLSQLRHELGRRGQQPRPKKCQA